VIRRALTLILILCLRTVNAQVYIRSAADSAAVVKAEIKAPGIHCFSGVKGLVKIPGLDARGINITISHKFFDTLKTTVKPGDIIYLHTGMTVLEPVIHTGNLSDKKTVKDMVAQTKVISAADIRNTGSQNLGDILRYQPNITLTNDLVLGTSISINGMSGQNVKLLKNGAAISGAMNGSIDVSQINVGNIEQIEIIEGPMSLLYGSNALAGTINLINKLPARKTQVTAKAHTESTGIYNVSAGVSKIIGKKYLNLHLGRNFFDGWNPGNRFFYNPVSREANAERNTLWKPRAQIIGDFFLFIPVNKQIDMKINSDYLNETIINKGVPSQPYFESAFDDYYRTIRNINSAEFNLRKKHFRHNLLLSYSYFNRTKNTFLKDLTQAGKGTLSGPESQDSTIIHTSQVRYIASSNIGKISLNWGVDGHHETFVGKRVLDNSQSIYNVSFVGIASYSIKNKYDFKIGARQTLHSLNKIPLIPSIYSKIRISKSMDIKLSAAMGYRTPGVKELYLYFVDINHNIKGNEALKSESSVNYNAVFTYRKKFDKNFVSLQLNSYYNTFRNLITLAAINTVEYTYVNIGKSESRGLNFEAKYERGRLETAYQGALISASNNNPDLPVTSYFNTFNHFMRGSFKFLKRKNLGLNLYVNNFGKSPSLAYVNEEAVVVYTQNYWMIDITTSYDLRIRNNELRLTAGLKNLNNITNLRSGLSNSGAHQSSTGQRIISSGRTVFLSLEYTL
jgi:outer membrane receptor for ferrienterochelin and colicins